MKSRVPNRLEQALAVGALDTSRRPEMLRALLAEPLWFPIGYHPELPPVFHPPPGGHLPVWICKDDEGTFVAVFTARDVMKDAMARLKQRHTVATMKGQDLCDALARQGHAMQLNPDSKFHAGFPLQAVRDLASGEMLSAEPMRYSADLRLLRPDMLPPAFVQTVIAECVAEPTWRALWMGDLGKTPDAPADLHHLHALVWVPDAARTPTDHLKKALRLALPNRDIEVVPIDESCGEGQLQKMLKSPTLYLRPTPPPVAGDSIINVQ